MKRITPHDPLDDLIAAALHGDLSPEERTQFESRLQNDPAAQATYLKAQAMHDLLNQTHRSAQPDPDFEQRMVSGVRRKLAHPPQEETAWESLLVLWTGTSAFFMRRRKPLLGLPGLFPALALLCIIALLAGVALGPITSGIKAIDPKRSGISDNYAASAKKGVTLSGYVDTSYTQQFGGRALPMSNAGSTGLAFGAGNMVDSGGVADSTAATTPQGGTIHGQVVSSPASIAFNSPNSNEASSEASVAQSDISTVPSASAPLPGVESTMPVPPQVTSEPVAHDDQAKEQAPMGDSPIAGRLLDRSGKVFGISSSVGAAASTPPAPTPADNRKLIRNAQLDLEVKSYQAAFDQISALTKSAGGYVDTSSSQRGGNGKLQGSVVVKILPENLDAFLLKLRELGDVQNQTVTTDDVTKDYYDTQARLVNSQKMEEQLQELLKHENGKVSDLLAVERELGRVRGDIEQMQGQLKLYDFQVQYATVTMNLAEKDLNQTAAYLLKEQDNFSLYATDVEGAFQKARAAADQFNAEVLAASLDHDVNSNNNQVAASLVVMVAPEQIEPFLAQVRSLGRVANFTRQTQRVAKDGGDSAQPADETKTEKDKVRVELSIRSDDDSRKQVALTVVTRNVNSALDQAKAAALANAGAEILGSSLNTTPEGASTAQLSVRVPGKDYSTLLEAFRALGRQASLSIQRNDNNGPGASGDDVPVILSLALTDNDQPVQETNLVIAADDVDTQAQQIKKQAGDAEVEIKSSSFQRQPDGTEQAQMTLRLPLAHYAAFLETLKKAGKVDSLSVQRDDRPDESRPNDAAPAEIQLQLHSQFVIVAENTGLWATLRHTFGAGLSTLASCITVIGVIIAFLVPWVIALVIVAWIGRRIYVWRRNRS